MRRRRIIIESVEPIADGSQQPPRNYLNISSAKLLRRQPLRRARPTRRGRASGESACMLCSSMREVLTHCVVSRRDPPLVGCSGATSGVARGEGQGDPIFEGTAQCLRVDPAVSDERRRAQRMGRHASSPASVRLRRTAVQETRIPEFLYPVRAELFPPCAASAPTADNDGSHAHAVPVADFARDVGEFCIGVAPPSQHLRSKKHSSRFVKRR